MKIEFYKAFRLSSGYYSGHWNCSKFADFVRGTKKPLSLGWDEWEGWEQKVKRKHPWRYWLAEDVLSGLQAAMYLPYSLYKGTYYAINARYFDKYWQVDTGLDRWGYHDPDRRLEFGVFSLLCEYVENRGYDFIKDVDCQDTHEGLSNNRVEESKKVLELYDWWQKRDEREEALEERLEACYGTREENDMWWKEHGDIEEEQCDELTEKLIEVIKLRSILWH